MEVLQDSYKDTKIGRIPKDWEVARLGEICKLLTGGTPSTKEPSYWGGDIPWMASGDIHNRYIEDVEGRITEEGLKNSAAKNIPTNSVLIALNGQGRTKGTVAINKTVLTCNQSIAAYVVNPSILNPFYLLNYLSSQYKQLRALAGGADRAGLNLGLLRTVNCPLPPLPEQQKIAEILSTVDEQIGATERIIEKSKELKKGLMQKLFSEGIGHTEFKDTKIGRIPKDWEVVRMKELVKINQGLQIPIAKRLTEPEEGAHFYITNEFLKKNSKYTYYVKDPKGIRSMSRR